MEKSFEYLGRGRGGFRRPDDVPGVESLPVDQLPDDPVVLKAIIRDLCENLDMVDIEIEEARKIFSRITGRMMAQVEG